MLLVDSKQPTLLLIALELPEKFLIPLMLIQLTSKF